MRLVFALALATFLSACGPTTPVISTPPASRFQPVAEPAIPAGDTDADVSAYISSLIDALRTANGRLLWLDDWRAGVSGKAAKH